jgi:NAD(P)H-dependent FMN reductase
VNEQRRPILQVVIGSTRPGRVGAAVADWFEGRAVKHGSFEVEVVDLAEVDLPMFDEPHHPATGRYEHQHTRDWSRTVSRAHAFVFVIPEYNHGFNAAVKNAIDYLHAEWQHKPVGIVSYGGVSAGLRSAQMLKPVLAGLKMVPMVEAVSIPFVKNLVEDGELVGNDPMERGADAMLDELAHWSDALAPLRERAA